MSHGTALLQEKGTVSGRDRAGRRECIVSAVASEQARAEAKARGTRLQRPHKRQVTLELSFAGSFCAERRSHVCMHAVPLQILGHANHLSLGSLVILARLPLHSIIPVSRLIVERATARHCSECKVFQDEQRICHIILFLSLSSGYIR